MQGRLPLSSSLQSLSKTVSSAFEIHTLTKTPLTETMTEQLPVWNYVLCTCSSQCRVQLTSQSGGCGLRAIHSHTAVQNDRLQAKVLFCVFSHFCSATQSDHNNKNYLSMFTTTSVRERGRILLRESAGTKYRNEKGEYCDSKRHNTHVC